MKNQLDKDIIKNGFIGGIVLPITKDNNVTYYCKVQSIGGKIKKHYFISCNPNSDNNRGKKGRIYTEDQLDNLIDKFIYTNLFLISNNNPVILSLIKFNTIGNIISNL